MKTIIRTAAIVCSLFAAGVLSDGLLDRGMSTREAQAIIGRPLTPLSYAGVARRTTRRTIRRTSIYVAALPRGCTTVVIDGVSLHQCGGAYYQAYGNQYVVVNVN